MRRKEKRSRQTQVTRKMRNYFYLYQSLSFLAIVLFVSFLKIGNCFELNESSDKSSEASSSLSLLSRGKIAVATGDAGGNLATGLTRVVGTSAAAGAAGFERVPAPMCAKSDEFLEKQLEKQRQVVVDPSSGQRTFKSKVVAIFSCESSATNESSAENDLSLDYRLARPAIELAIAEAKHRYPTVSMSVSFRSTPGVCRRLEAAGIAADEFYTSGANFIVGPGCSEALESVGRLASHWNVPVCSTGYLPEVVSASMQPQTLIQLSLSVQAVGELLLELCQLYKWRHLVILTDDKHPLHAAIRDGLIDFFYTLYKSRDPKISAGKVVGSTSGGGGSSSDSIVDRTTGGEATGPQLANVNNLTFQSTTSTANNNSSPSFLSQQSINKQQGKKNEQVQQNPARVSNSKSSKQKVFKLQVVAKNFAESKTEPLDYGQVMAEAGSHSRIMFFLAKSKTIDKLLTAAHSLNMSSGKFVFIAHELFEIQNVDEQKSSGKKQKSSFFQQHSQSNQDNESSEFKDYYSQDEMSGKNQASGAFSISDELDLARHKYRNSSSSSSSSSFPSILSDDLSQSMSIHSMNGINKHEPISNAWQEIPDEQVMQASKQRFLRPEIYAPLMTISLRIPVTPQFIEFRKQVARQSENQFGKQFQVTSLRSVYSLSIAALIYDCVLLYAKKVSDVLLSKPEVSQIDGKLLFDMTRNMSFDEALTGSVLLNNAGQRVVDFTLSDFSLESQSLEPIAHFWARERRLAFIAGKAPHWQARNMSVPHSNPRCMPAPGNPNACNLSSGNNPSNEINSDNGDGDTDPSTAATTAAAAAAAAAAATLGARLALIGAALVAGTSLALAYLVFRRFRIESELLNLWWSINYDELVFEDDCVNDGKRSVSSLALSSESFAATCNPLAQANASSASNLSAKPRSSSPQQQQQPAVIIEPRQVHHLSVNTTPSGRNNSSPQGQVSVPSSTVSSPRAQLGAGNKLTTSSSAPRLASQTNQRNVGLRASGKDNGQYNQQQQQQQQQVQQKQRQQQQRQQQHKKNAKLALGSILNAGNASAATHPTKVGLYKGSRVAVKHLNVRNLSINRKLLVELRQVRDLTHENLVKFIGLCAEEPNVAIVSELCSRGNLQDLLQNSTIRLDWTFRYSIINDIVDGLAHLHASPIQYHGRLKSSNCVIDNRFVVKLTDFGLPTLVQAFEAEVAVGDLLDTNTTESNVNLPSLTGASASAAAASSCKLLLWTAPEHLRTKRPLASGSQRGDIYSLAIIFQEIVTRCAPFECEPVIVGPGPTGPLAIQQMSGRTPDNRGNTPTNPQLMVSGSWTTMANNQQQQFQYQQQHRQRLEPEEIVNLVRMGLSPPFRPYFRPDIAIPIDLQPQQPQQQSQQQQQQQLTGVSGCGSGSGNTQATGSQSIPDFNIVEFVKLVQSCWAESPLARPSIQSVKVQVKRMRRTTGGNQLLGGGGSGNSANLMDNLLQRMERYTDNLESLVEQKTAELMEEKKRSEELLYEMLPRFVVEQLKYGLSVTPEAYEAVTVCFSDIKDFTSIAASSSPIQVVQLLNLLYTEFDACIAKHDVYKVETIGDAYMTVSGLPVKNGHFHAKEIADMSLSLLELISEFKIPHLPTQSVRLRIGAHSGPCASGVVGTKMFRYCLFGDTVNVASRMESHGEPMKIHISEQTASVLEKFNNQYIIEPRGLIDIKGKGPMNTFWLLGRSEWMKKSDDTVETS